MGYFLRYPDIEQTKHKSKKISALDFLGLGLKLAQIFTSISSINWHTIFFKFDLDLFLSYQKGQIYPYTFLYIISILTYRKIYLHLHTISKKKLL